VLFFISCHSRLSGILLQNKMLQRENKKDSGLRRELSRTTSQNDKMSVQNMVPCKHLKVLLAELF
jgi:hypothetical protein